MANLIHDQCYNAWVEQQWKTPPITKAEYVSESQTNVLRFIFIDGSVKYLKKMDSEERIQKILHIYEALHQHDVRIAEIKQTVNGEWWAAHDGELYMLSNELKGRVINELGPEFGECYGQGLATLHEALRDNMSENRYPEMDLVQQLTDWAAPRTIEVMKKLGLIEELNSFIDLMTSIGYSQIAQLPKQVIHRDPHPGNMLYGEDGVIGFLDFEISVTGIRLFDLCYLCTSQWMTAYSDPKKQNTWIELIREIRHGYEKVVTLLIEERSSAFFVMCAIQMIFISFWQGQKREDMMKMNLEALFELIKIKGKIDDAFSL